MLIKLYVYSVARLAGPDIHELLQVPPFVFSISADNSSSSLGPAASGCFRYPIARLSLSAHVTIV